MRIPLLSLLVTALAAQPAADPKSTEIWTPAPPVVKPGHDQTPPSDAVVLFDGIHLDAWESEQGGPSVWTVADGVLTVRPDKGKSGLVSKQSFGDCQLHLEWRTPAKVAGSGQGRGNSGVYLQKRYEIQILDSYDNPTYVNGQAGAVYKQHIPQVNASRGPGEWQSYDIIYHAPRFHTDGSLDVPATVTVLHNGLLVQDHVTIQGATDNRGHPAYAAHPLRQPLLLQEHKNPVSFRNIWIRELPVTAAPTG